MKSSIVCQFARPPTLGPPINQLFHVPRRTPVEGVFEYSARMLTGRDRPIWLVVYDRACKVMALVVLLKLIGVPMDEKLLLPVFVSVIVLLVVRTLSLPTLVCAVGLSSLISLANGLETRYAAMLLITFVCTGAVWDRIHYLVFEHPNRRPIVERFLRVPLRPMEVSRVFE